MQENNAPSWFDRHRFWTVVLMILILLAVILVLMQFLPVTVNDASVSDPSLDPDESTRRVLAIRNAEEASGVINPVCESLLMTHGEFTPKVIVFFHGFTSCPEQFRELGQQFYDMGYNVYIPLIPDHGRADRDRDALLGTTAEELAAFATQSMDIAYGLGEEVIVAGLSGGGTIAAWVAQTREDVNEAVIIAPFLGIGFIPTPLNRSIARILDDIPNFDMWWDPSAKENNPLTANYAYPGYPLRALAEYLRLGFATQDLAKQQKPGVDSIVVITNAHDESVNHGITNQLVQAWQQHGEEYLRTYEFERALNLPHDLITPTREDSNPGLVYPVIIDSIQQ
jgi:alpha-beta hydrolase superfamily lysophospholipase